MNAGHERIRNLGAAGVLAIFAAVLAAVALPHHGGAAKAQAASNAPQAKVLVATRDLSVGTSVAQALASKELVVRTVAADSVQPDALTSRVAAGGKVVVQPIYAGEQVTANRLGATGQAELHADLTGVDRIMQVSGTAEQELAGTLHDGDHVDVVVSVQLPNKVVAAVAVRNLLVVAAPTSTSDASVSASSSGQTVTTLVQMTDAQTARLFYAMKNGNWAFVLRPSSKVASTKKTEVDALGLVKGR